MSFYSLLSQYYDRLFPMEPVILSFLLDHLPKVGPVVDVACGTGTYAFPLAEKGYTVSGIDQDRDMIRKAQERLEREYTGKEEARRLSFALSGMENIAETVPGPQKSAFCIGNSLVHLPNTGAVATFLKSLSESIVPGGTIILQIINFDRILEQRISELPALEGDGVKLIRKYVINEDSGSVLFDTELQVPENGTTQVFRQQIPLIALRSSELLALTEAADFRDISLYGSYQGDSYDSNSFLTILLAKKR